jgi:hypothetical protein
LLTLSPIIDRTEGEMDTATMHPDGRTMKASFAHAYRHGVPALVVCLPVAALIGLAAGIAEWNVVIGVGLAVAFGMYATVGGLVLVLVYGAPAYALLVRFGVATYLSSIAVGILPGVVLAVIGELLPFGIWLLCLGPLVGAATHWLSNQSSRSAPSTPAA